MNSIERLLELTRLRNVWEFTDDFAVDSDLDLEAGAIIFTTSKELIAYKLSTHFLQLGLYVEIIEMSDNYRVIVKEKNNG